MLVRNNTGHLIQCGRVKLAPGDNDLDDAGILACKTDYREGFTRMVAAGWLEIPAGAPAPARAGKPTRAPADPIVASDES